MSKSKAKKREKQREIINNYMFRDDFKDDIGYEMFIEMLTKVNVTRLYYEIKLMLTLRTTPLEHIINLNREIRGQRDIGVFMEQNFNKEKY